jgi:DNA-binding XRE family transcriptional regulator
MEKARAFAAVEDPSRLWRLQDLAAELGVHVRTLRAAARSGRLDVTYENRVVFRNPIPKATLDASRTFMARFYRQSYSRFAVKPTMPPRTHVPQDCASKLLALRRRLQLSQAELAARVGAAGKAVVYQWESGKRRPSEIFWCRIETLLDL